MSGPPDGVQRLEGHAIVGAPCSTKCTRKAKFIIRRFSRVATNEDCVAVESKGAFMSSNRLVAGLVIAVVVATGALVVGSTLSKAANKRPLDHVHPMKVQRAAVPTMPGQEVLGTIQE